MDNEQNLQNNEENQNTQGSQVVQRKYVKVALRILKNTLKRS